jgi:hypothetical protein
VSARRAGRAAVAGLCAWAALAGPPPAGDAHAAAPKATGRAATEIGTCDARQLGEWQFVAREQMRVQARGRSGNDWVGLTAATDGFHDWAPFDDFKTTICGALGIFGTFEPTRQSEILRFLPEIPEHDWNVILIPTGRTIFDERFKLAQRLMERGHEGDLVSCSGTPCFEAEITPQTRLLKANAAGGWLSACRRGQTICTFGPWVGDGGHGYRPEIHPAERIWWRDGERLKLLAVQDASQRFRDHRQYQWADTPEPKRWHPWAAPSMQGEFRVAFEAAREPAAPVDFMVEQMLDANVRGVKPAVAAADMTYAFTQGGTEVGRMRVHLGLGATSERLELAFSTLDIAPDDVCVRPDGGSLQGYLRLHDVIGYRHQEGEGFNTFEVVPPRLLGEPAPPSPDPSCATCKAPVADDASHTLHVATLILAREERVDRSTTMSERVLADLLRAATEKPEPPPLLARAASRKENASDIVLQSARRFRLSVRPHYDGPRGERLESAIDHGDGETFRKLLVAAGAAVPVRVQWDVHVRNFSAGGGEEPGACVPAGERHLLEADECAIDLPAGVGPDDVLRVWATARLLDAQGQPIPESMVVGVPGGSPAAPARQEIRLASHFIRATNVQARDRILSWLGNAFAPANDLVKAATAPEEVPVDFADLGLHRRSYHARMLRHGLVLATVDQRITLDELRQFVEMAQLFADLPPLGAVPQAPTVK